MQDRLKSIKSIAKAIKLRLPFEPGNDNMHDLLDAIVSLCDESVGPNLEPVKTKKQILKSGTEYYLKPHEPIKRVKVDGVECLKIEGTNETTRVKAYLINEMWLVVGIPKRQPFHEQVFWCANKGATKIKMEHDGEESEVLISQIKQQ